MEFQAGARWLAVSGHRQHRHRPPQRHRTRNPDDPQRPSPRQGDAATGSTAAVDGRPEPRVGARRVSGRRWLAQVGGHAGVDAAAVPLRRSRARYRIGAGRAPRRSDRWPARLRRPTHRRRPPCHRRGAHGGPARRPHPDPRRRIKRHGHLRDADRSAIGRVVRRVGPRGDQRLRRVGGGGGHLDQAAAQPRNTSRLRRQGFRQSHCRADDSDSRRDQPIRVRDARTAGPGVSGADRRGRSRPGSRCAAADVGRDLVPAEHREHRAGRRARRRRRDRRVRRAAAVDRHRRRGHARPTYRGITRWSSRRRVSSA